MGLAVWVAGGWPRQEEPEETQLVWKPVLSNSSESLTDSGDDAMRS